MSNLKPKTSPAPTPAELGEAILHQCLIRHFDLKTVEEAREYTRRHLAEAADSSTRLAA